MEKIFGEVFAATYAATIASIGRVALHEEHVEAMGRASQAAFVAVSKFQEMMVPATPTMSDETTSASGVTAWRDR